MRKTKLFVFGYVCFFSSHPHRFWHLANWASRLVRRDRKLSESFFWLGFEIHKRHWGALTDIGVWGARFAQGLDKGVCGGTIYIARNERGMGLGLEYLASTYDE